MKISPLKISTNHLPENTGTGRVNKEEVFPYTPTLLKRFGMEDLELPVPDPLVLTEELKERFKRLRPYQLEDVLLMANRAVGLILSDPRTGKTPTAISIFSAKDVTKYIVVCPASITMQWQEEIESWSDNAAWVAKGTKAKRLKLYKEWEQGVIVISYETLRLDYDIILKENKDIQGIILDEAHKIKNPKTLTFFSVLKMSKIKHKLVLTGTLAPNRAHETFGVFHFAYPKIFTSYWRFVYYYFNTETQELRLFKYGKPVTETYESILSLKHERELQEFLGRVAIRRTQAEVMPWLPEKDYVRIRLEPTKDQKKYIEEMMKYYETEHVIVENVLTQLLRVRQICMAPELLELKGKSPKIEWIKQFIKDFDEESIVIFSYFTSFLKLLSLALGGVPMIAGHVSTEERNRLKKSFQEGTIKVLLVNIVAGKEGLTLDKAGIAIFCDNYPPASNITQAENRITATREELAGKDNKIYQLMMADTYDERLYELVANNIQEIDIVNDFKKYLEGYNE